jgi:hypothetical protein
VVEARRQLPNIVLHIRSRYRSRPCLLRLFFIAVTQYDVRAILSTINVYCAGISFWVLFPFYCRGFSSETQLTQPVAPVRSKFEVHKTAESHSTSSASHEEGAVLKQSLENPMFEASSNSRARTAKHKKRKSLRQGIEPRSTSRRLVVLPLHHRRITQIIWQITLIVDR